MKNSLITILRDQKTDSAVFRKTAEKITNLLLAESVNFIKEKRKSVQTPIAKALGYEPKQGVILVPILRAGLAFLPKFLEFYEDAKVGFVGLKRDEKTAIANEYYNNLPKIKKSDMVVVLDPMIATGGSAVSALQSIKKAGAKEENILFISLASALPGLKKIKKNFPKIKIITTVTDKTLNKDKFIVPGIGDFGDRYFANL